MAAAGCVFLRSLSRARPGTVSDRTRDRPGTVSDRTRDRPGTGPDRTRDRPGPSQVSLVCRDVLRVLELRRYTRDLGSSVYFPQAVLQGADLYDATLTDGDCRVQVSLDPGLNVLVERRVLRPGRTLYSSTFSAAMSAQLPACPGASGGGDSFRLLWAELREEPEDGGDDGTEDWDALPWFGSSSPAGPPLPLRANRSVFLPLWNDVDPNGAAWTEAPPPEDDPDEDQGGRPGVTVSQLRDDFLSGRRRLTRSAVERQLIVRIIHKSRLLYYGKADRNCPCPYKALLEVCDPTGSVCVVLWNSACVHWFCRLKPGDIISLRRYRVKARYPAQSDDIEVSVNSRNPHTHISVLPESSVCPAHLPAPPTYTFYNSQEVQDQPHGALCDVIGLLTFSGRSERIRSEDGRGAGLLEYRWLRLDDGASDQPIMVKLFSTSQPEVHQQLLPLSVVVCCRLKVVHCPPSYFLTNTTFTQVYSTGHHSHMAYRRLRPVRRFLRWLRLQDDGQVLNRALIGGSFVFPPPPVSLETYLWSRQGDPGFLRGAELQRAMERLCYRERRTFCIQATVTMVTTEDQRRFWTDRTSSPAPPPPALRPPPPALRPPPPALRPPPPALRPPVLPVLLLPGVSVLITQSSDALQKKKKLFSTAEASRCPWGSLQQDHNSGTVLFEASMEFLHRTEEEEEEDGDDTSSSFVTAPLPPDIPPVAMETLPMHYDPTQREEQAVAMATGGGRLFSRNFVPAVKEYYTLRLRALPDGVLIDTVFLPQSSSSCHSNTWTSILSHGAFSSDSPPPSSADLITTAPQLANQRLACVLEVCHLGGACTEVILSRAFCLN